MGNVRRAIDAKNRKLQMKALLTQAKKKASAYPHDDDAYWVSRRRSFAYEKAQLEGKLDAWMDPNAEKKEAKKKEEDHVKAEKDEAIKDAAAKEKVGKDALRDQLALMLTPDLVKAVAASALDGVAPKSVDDDEQKLKDAKDAHATAVSFEASLNTRVKGALARMKAGTQEIEDAITLDQAPDAKARVKRAEKSHTSNEAQLKLAKVKVARTAQLVADQESVLKKIKDAQPDPELAHLSPDAVLMAKSQIADKEDKVATDEKNAMNNKEKEQEAKQDKADNPDSPDDTEEEEEVEPLTAAQRRNKDASDAKDLNHKAATKTNKIAIEAKTATKHLKALKKSQVHDPRMAPPPLH